jgi:hypothetical protein
LVFISIGSSPDFYRFQPMTITRRNAQPLQEFSKKFIHNLRTIFKMKHLCRRNVRMRVRTSGLAAMSNFSQRENKGAMKAGL